MWPMSYRGEESQADSCSACRQAPCALQVRRVVLMSEFHKYILDITSSCRAGRRECQEQKCQAAIGRWHVTSPTPACQSANGNRMGRAIMLAACCSAAFSRCASIGVVSRRQCPNSCPTAGRPTPFMMPWEANVCRRSWMRTAAGSALLSTLVKNQYRREVVTFFGKTLESALRLGRNESRHTSPGPSRIERSPVVLSGAPSLNHRA